ncbi:MAG: hypothetical protein ACOY5Y_17310 [Pseudomonadota bacterium]|jgi:hypothetical protein
MKTTPARLIPVTVLLGAAALAACSDERSAEVSTGAAEAEVSTTLPESQVSDQQLEAAAEGAAALADTPGGANTAVVVTPPEAKAERTAPPAE